MERGVVIGGLLVGVSLLLAAVLNSYATRDAVAMPAPSAVAPEYDKADPAERSPVKPAVNSIMPDSRTTSPPKQEEVLGRPLDLVRAP